MFEQLAQAIGEKPDIECQEVEFKRVFYYPDSVVGFLVGALLKMGEPFKMIPTKDGYYLHVRIECRENHIKQCLWDEFPGFREELIKRRMSRPNAATDLEPFICER